MAYLACENAQIKPGHKILIFGAGPIGLLTALMSKEIFGAVEVHLVEPVNFRRQFTQKWADQVYDVEDFLANNLEKFDIVVEASGNLNNINAIFIKINPNGHVVLLARSGEALLLEAIDHMITNQKNNKKIDGFCYPVSKRIISSLFSRLSSRFININLNKSAQLLNKWYLVNARISSKKVFLVPNLWLYS